MGSSPPGTPVIRKPPKRPRMRYERRVTLFAVFAALPGILVSGVLIFLQSWSVESKLALFIAELLAWALAGMALHEQAIRPLQTLSNVVASLREEDYSFRARGTAVEDALGELSLEVNALADMLAGQRIHAIEATALLRRVVEEIDIPLFAFDPAQALRLVNSAGERLLQKPAARLMGNTAAEIGLQDCLTVENEGLVPLHLNGSNARWLVRRSSFRQNGVPHTLLVLSDVSRALREEERRAWQRLVRVLGHELNNSLAPIKSIAGSLSTRIAEVPLGPEHRQDFLRGLEIIEARAASLNRFLQAYRQLAQIPPPVLRETQLGPVVKRVADLETRVKVAVLPGPEIVLMVDPDQIEQMLINLVRNAVEAVLAPAQTENGRSGVEAGPPEIVIRWEGASKEVALTIEDNGPGLLNPSNVFTPFYTTKPAGSGIGLVLSRQIAEAHGGTIELSNRKDKTGCVVRIALPRMPARVNATR